jgi:hypothetical protein
MIMDILKALKLMEEGFTSRRTAKEMGMEHNVFLRVMNIGNGMNCTRVESMLIKGDSAQSIYDRFYKPEEDEPELQPEEVDDRTDVQITHELLRNILRELQVMNGRSAIFNPPPHVRAMRKAIEDEPVIIPKRQKVKVSKAKPWSDEEDDYLWTAYGVDPDNYVEEFKKKYPKRITQGIKMRLYQLQQKDKKNVSSY